MWSRHPRPPSQWAVDLFVMTLLHAMHSRSFENGWKTSKTCNSKRSHIISALRIQLYQVFLLRKDGKIIATRVIRPLDDHKLCLIWCRRFGDLEEAATLFMTSLYKKSIFPYMLPNYSICLSPTDWETLEWRIFRPSCSEVTVTYRVSYSYMECRRCRGRLRWKDITERTDQSLSSLLHIAGDRSLWDTITESRYPKTPMRHRNLVSSTAKGHYGQDVVKRVSFGLFRPTYQRPIDTYYQPISNRLLFHSVIFVFPFLPGYDDSCQMHSKSYRLHLRVAIDSFWKEKGTNCIIKELVLLTEPILKC